VIHRGNARTWYGDGWSIHFFPWGLHVRRRRRDGLWRQHRLGFGSHRPGTAHTRLIDYSARTTRTAQGKPISPCWRFWIGVQMGHGNWSKANWPGADPYQEASAPVPSQPVSGAAVGPATQTPKTAGTREGA
jgi:hypothetical protein